jgi:hypothetical protein
MKTQPMHTPTPWIQGAFGAIEGAKEGNGIPRDFVAKVEPLNGFGRFVDSEKAKANAAFIVRAVNSHEELIGLVKAILKDGIDNDWYKDAERVIAKTEVK